MKLRLYVAFLALTIVAIVFLRWNYRITSNRVELAQPAHLPALPSPTEESLGGASSARLAPDERGGGAAPTTPVTIQTEMETVKFFLRDFRASLGENPVGNNAEITKALLGANRTKTQFVVPGDPHVNAAGEFCDPWGTPYFFHALSAREMEIRSAGPDKRMWTADDIVLR